MNLKRILKFSFWSLYFAALLGFFVWLGFRPAAKTIPEKIADTVVFVNLSSGTIVYSDKQTALVLTAYHVIAGDNGVSQCSGCPNDTVVVFLHSTYYPGMKGPVFSPEGYKVMSFEADPENDLALLEVSLGHRVAHSSLAATDPKLGDEVWTASNPNRLYRSVKKGVVSSKSRFTYSAPYYLWEISNGIINGSSGGGVFNVDGRLIGVIDSVNIYTTNNCFGLFNMETGKIEDRCLDIPITFAGFIIPPETMRGFVLGSAFGGWFGYLSGR